MSHSVKRSCSTPDLSVLKDVNVLVVEDNWQVAKALECALKQLEMQVSGPASTTSDAKRLVAAQMPTVAIVDVNLKREMACDLIVELHEKGVHVIVISGYAIPPIPKKKAAVILQKPFSAEDLLTALRTVVVGQGTH
ncbi:MAG: response regulator [Hyphomicrobiaceae bacterium]|jgi:two-component system, response regulator PdtaR